MMTARRVLLFDLDGVLIAPHGYRRAIQASLEHFTRRMGLGDCYPGEENIARFEAISMTSEWDIVPTCLAALLDALLADHPGLLLPGRLEAVCTYLGGKEPSPAPVVDYISLAQRLGVAYRGGAYLDLVLALCQPVAEKSPGAISAGLPQPLFPHLAGHPLLEDLLRHTRQVTISPTTRVFQSFALGSAAYRQTYAQPPALDSLSFLKEYDQALISVEIRRNLLRAWQAGEFDLAVCTLRPSLPGVDGADLKLSYSPEAELALEVAGLPGVPLVGYGQVCRLAELTGRSPEELVKPSPVQALAAIGAAVHGDVLPALLGAERLVFASAAAYFHTFPPLEVHIFEDAAGGVRAVRQAAVLLQAAGLQVVMHAWGISANPDKTAALLQAGAMIYPDINQALNQWKTLFINA
jgi:hypothetical protein